MYAYEMLQEMARLSDGVLQFNTLYIAIYRLQEHGYISPSETVVTESNRTRVYFSITEQGSRYLDDIIAEYRRVTQTIDSVGGNSISARPGSIYTVTHLKKIYLRSKSAQQ